MGKMIKPRKERLMEARKKRQKARHRKLAGIAFAAAIIAGCFITFGGNMTEAAYIVKEDDTLYRIAKNHAVSVNEIKELNQLSDDKIFAGQSLEVPSVEFYKNLKNNAALHIVSPGETLWGIASLYDLSVEDLKRMNQLDNDIVLANQRLIVMDELSLKKAKIIGAADDLILEFQSNNEFFALKTPFHSAAKLQSLAGKELFITYKNNSLISIKQQHSP
ncbi:LysM peptidoglycan-binding domain-containing protein [Cytobacillus horneckiae]|uniref:LysM peptidoglycan-binding domain-containing protein n=1 Tax=Cytobacillus horneckiae TaxID=549687 RepID=A0A2N0ZFU6_9BACI|nr:LysM peptidoglycan-binding domain-containing protein [Cytobacillus horneckiae]MEC1154408.1 LysM peptidoglycan-binding domain-containing protein [Cytobacillus horneckiae]MED2937743.1 LysM peptidoglycan-binding domain-containing protein [Cytobacillus horneckiae]PKG28392.1 LysM peptidoglycan-binding domain-containing protein [Cytobacillus horneckiae]